MSWRDPDLVCHDCGRKPTGARARCPCGEPLWFSERPISVDPDWLPATIWDHSDALPTEPGPGLLGVVGGTPLFRAPPLDAATGARVYLKDERANPTGTFKDRGSAVGVAVAGASDRSVLTVSHGNMARSVAAMAAAAGVECAILVPADIPGGRLWPIARYDTALFRVRGDYGGLYRDTLELPGPIALNSDVPLRVAGQKTLAYEIATQAPDADAIVLPVSSGGNASAVWKGYRELVAGGSLASPPRLYLVQASACDPIAQADRDDLSRIPAVEAGDTVAYSIANPDPPSGWRALRAARATDGGVVSVDDDAIERAQERLAGRAGVSAEAAAATTIAGIRTLAAAERIRPHEDVVAVITGTGLLEGSGAPPDVPVVDRDAVASALRERFER